MSPRRVHRCLRRLTSAWFTDRIVRDIDDVGTVIRSFNDEELVAVARALHDLTSTTCDELDYRLRRIGT